MRFDRATTARAVGLGTAALAAAMISAPVGQADPTDPAVPVIPAPVAAPAAAPVAASAAAAPAAVPAAQDVDPAAAPAAAPAPVPHLSSPENLPPGTSDDPVGPQEGPGATYAHEIWEQVQTQDISVRQGLLLLIAQRPMNANTAPPPGMSSTPNPQGPQGLGDPAPAAPAAPASPVPTP